MTAKMERFVNEEDHNVYHEVADVGSVGFVNPTYTSHEEASAEFQKPPIDGIHNGHVTGNQHGGSQRVVRTSDIVIPHRGNESEKEIRKWKRLLMVVIAIALVLIIALLAALIIVLLKNKECSGQPREPISSTVVGSIGPGGKCFCDPSACGQRGDAQPTYKPKPVKPTPPKSADILLACHPGIGDDGKAMVNDLCWVNETTLYAVQLDGRRVLRIDINLDTKSCAVNVIDKDFKPRRVTCAPNGDVFVSVPTSGFVKIYHADGTTSNWTMAEVASPRNIAIGDAMMVVDHNGTSPFTVYGLDKKYIQTMKVANNENEILYTHMTEAGDFIATGHHTHKLYIHNVMANTSIAVAGYGQKDGLFDSPGDLVDTPGGFILVCDWKNHRVSVFNRGGKYVGHIEFKDGAHQQPNALSYLVRKGNKPDIMALAPFPESIIWIYTMDY